MFFLKQAKKKTLKKFYSLCCLSFNEGQNFKVLFRFAQNLLYLFLDSRKIEWGPAMSFLTDVLHNKRNTKGYRLLF